MLLLLILLLLLLLMLLSEFDERLVLGVLFAPNMLFNLLVDERIEGDDSVSITSTKFEGNTPILPLSFPLHQPVTGDVFVMMGFCNRKEYNFEFIYYAMIHEKSV